MPDKKSKKTSHRGRQHKMRPQPDSGQRDYRGSGKPANKAALITGGDSGIGRAVAVLFAKEGADVSIVSEKQLVRTSRLSALTFR